MTRKTFDLNLYTNENNNCEKGFDILMPNDVLFGIKDSRFGDVDECRSMGFDESPSFFSQPSHDWLILVS